MRKVIIIVFLLGLSCSQKPVDLNGSWLIIQMTHKKQSVYPDDLTHEISFRIKDYENAAEISFWTEDSMVIVPGFHSEKIPLKCEIDNEDSIRFYFDDDLLGNYKTKHLDSFEESSFMEFSVGNEEWYRMKDSIQTIRNHIIKDKGSQSSQYDRAKDIYCQKYGVSYKQSEGMMLLKSEQTVMLLIRQDYLSNKEVERLFKGL